MDTIPQGRTYVFPAGLSKAGHAALGEMLENHRQLYNACLQHRFDVFDASGPQTHPWTVFVPELEDMVMAPPKPYSLTKAVSPVYFPTGEKVKRVFENFNDQNLRLKILREKHPVWEGQDRRLGTDTQKRVDKSFARWRKNRKEGLRGGKPRFKGRGRFRTLEIYAGANRYLREDGPGRHRLQIKGLPSIKVRHTGRRELPEGQPNVIRIVRRARRVEVQLCYMVDFPAAPPATGKVVGLDRGIINRVMTSDGIATPKRVRDTGVVRRQKRYQRKLDKLREMARDSDRAKWRPNGRIGRDGKPKGRYEWIGKPTKAYRETRRKLSKLLEREGDRNRQHLHRISRDILAGLQPGDTVSWENLEIPNMMKNHHLAKAIAEQGWGELIRQIGYKAESAGLHTVGVPPAYTSQDCSGCGARVKKDLSVRVHACPNCGLILDRDENAARNIGSKAIAQTIGTDGIPSVEAAGARVNSPRGGDSVSDTTRPVRGRRRKNPFAQGQLPLGL